MAVFNLMSWIYILVVLVLAILSVVKIKHRAGMFLALALGAQVFAFLIQTVWYMITVGATLPHEVIRTIGFVIRMGGLVFMGMAIFEFSKHFGQAKAVPPEE